jgi:hypothetical protein
MLGQIARASREQASSLASGQIVIVSARWVLILAALALTLWSPAPEDLNRLRLGLFVVLGLAMGNFYLHAQIMMRRPVSSGLVYLASAADLAVITVLTATFGGPDAPMFVFYYPALLALALVFPLSVTLGFTGVLVWVYALITLGDPYRWLRHLDEADTQILVARLISLVAVAVVANQYARIEAERRASYAAGRSAQGAAGRRLPLPQ